MADTAHHTVRSFDDDLALLRTRIGEMGGLVEAQIAAAVDVLTRRDVDAAVHVIADDKAVDALEHEAEKLAITTPCTTQTDSHRPGTPRSASPMPRHSSCNPTCMPCKAMTPRRCSAWASLP